MPAIIIAAVVIGVFMILTFSLLTPRYAKKLCLNMPDRRLIETRIRSQSLVRRLVIIQILIGVSFVLLMSAKQYAMANQDIVFAFFIVFLFFCIGLRSMFRNMKIAAEAELEFRKLHASSEGRDNLGISTAR